MTVLYHNLFWYNGLRRVAAALWMSFKGGSFFASLGSIIGMVRLLIPAGSLDSGRVPSIGVVAALLRLSIAFASLFLAPLAVCLDEDSEASSEADSVANQPAENSQEPRAAVQAPAGGAVAPVAVMVQAQNVPLADAKGAETGRTVFQRPERRLLRSLEEARQMLADGLYTQAMRQLQELIEDKHDFFLIPGPNEPDSGGHYAESLKGEAENVLRSLPKEVREIYLLQYEARAKKLVATALAEGSYSLLAQAARTYPLTRSGRQAALFLALWHLESGRPGEAAIYFEDLRKPGFEAEDFEPLVSVLLAACKWAMGQTEEAREILIAVRSQAPLKRFVVRGRPIEWWKAGEDPLTWLQSTLGIMPAYKALPEPVEERVLQVRFNAARNGQLQGEGALLSGLWRAPTAEYPEIDAVLTRIEDFRLSAGSPTVPSMVPLIVGDKALLRTVRGLIAVDLGTGKRTWEAPANDPFERFLGASAGVVNQYGPALQNLLQGRVWSDATYGRLSSDGRRVFAVEDLERLTERSDLPIFFPNNRLTSAANIPRFNRLVAYDLETGKPLWHLGVNPEQTNAAGASIFFLGVPLVLGGDEGFVLGEINGEIKLLALDLSSGSILWEQSLAAVEQPLSEVPLRRWCGLAPSYQDGILVCPTLAGAIVGIDRLRQRLAWGYAYRSEWRSGPSGIPRPRQIFGTLWDEERSGLVRDDSVIIADGRIVVAPSDSSDIHCLDLRTGKPLWKKPREDLLYIACVFEKNVVLVGNQGMRAVRLSADPAPIEGEQGTQDSQGSASDSAAADQAAQEPAEFQNFMEPVNGEEIAGPNAETVGVDCGVTHLGGEESNHPRPQLGWNGSSVVYPAGARPAGFGYRSGSRYFLPLTDGQILVIELRTGRVISSFRGPETLRLGNLVSAGGVVLSQSAKGLDAFPELGQLRRRLAEKMAAGASDPEVVVAQAQLLKQENRLREALDLLRRAWGSAQTTTVRDLLRETWFCALEQDFAAFKGLRAELEEILETPAEKATLLRLWLHGLYREQDYAGAWEACRKLIRLDLEHADWDAPEQGLRVRRSTWLQAELVRLYEAAGPELRAQIQSEAETTLSNLRSREGFDGLKRWLEYYESLPIGAQAALELAEYFMRDNNSCEAAHWYQRLLAHSNRTAAAMACATLMELARARQQPAAAAAFARLLKKEFGEINCRGEVTGREFTEKLAEDPRLARYFQRLNRWPPHLVVKTQPATGTQMVAFPSRNRLASISGGLRAQVGERVILEVNPPVVWGEDSLGNRAWQFPVAALPEAITFEFNRAVTQASAVGWVVLLVGQSQALALDTLNLGPQRMARPLWRFDLMKLEPVNLHEEGEQGGRAAREIRRPLGMGWEGRQFLSQDFFGATPVAIGARWFGLKMQHRLVAVDAFSGAPMWIRTDLPPDASVVSDGRVVIAWRSNLEEFVLYEAASGRLIGRRKPPFKPVLPRSQRVAVVVPAPYEPTFVGSAILYMKEVKSGHFGQAEVRRIALYDLVTEREVWESPPIEGPSFAIATTPEVLGIWEGNGSFSLLWLEDGRLLGRYSLDKPGEDAKFRLLQTPEQILAVFARGGEHIRRLGANTWQLPGVESEPIVDGFVWAFDLAGTPIWTEPTRVTNQWLPIDQPSELPLLVFACTCEGTGRDSSSNSPQTGLLCIDRRTGKTVLERRLDLPTLTMQLVGDESSNTMEVRFQRNKLVFEFVDSPPDSAASPSKAHPGGNLLDSLWKAAEEYFSTPSGSER